MAENSFKFVGGNRVQLGRTHELFRNPVTGVSAIAQKDLLSAASLCRSFAPMHEHVSRVEARLGANSDAGAHWASVLEGAVQTGLLMTEQDITNYILASFAELPQRRAIETIAIPTRNRPKMLARLLTSLSDHLRQFGRSV